MGILIRLSNVSKPLEVSDESGFEFVKEMLDGDPTFGINFDRIQWDSEGENWVIIEYLRCHKKQFSRGITPYSSHPNRYFNKNARKFIALWILKNVLNARLYLVNYAKRSENTITNQVKLMEVLKINEEGPNFVVTVDQNMNRKEFSNWLRDMNKRGEGLPGLIEQYSTIFKSAKP